MRDTKKENLRILISAVGMTDPISNEHDGSILHISRIYQPDIVYLYMSKRILDFHDQDDRYQKCIKWLGEKLDHEFEIRLIKDKDMVEVQEYDVFIDIFQQIIKDVVKAYPKAEIFLNVSSGSPAMKGALQTIPYVTEYSLRPIQVSTPVADYNKYHEDHEDYNVDIQWELNRDNKSDFQNRCKESNGKNLLTTFKKEQVIKYIRNYHYISAYLLAKGMDLSAEALLWMEIAKERYQLNLEAVLRICDQNDLAIPYIPVKEEPYRNTVEYLLNLQVKLLHADYGDFIRGITPVVLDLFLMIAEEQCGINLENCTTKENEILMWDKAKLSKVPEVLQSLNQAFGNDFKYGPVYSSALSCLILPVSDQQLKKLIKQIRNCEKDVRNSAAHTMVSVTPEWIQKRCGSTPEEIMDCLKSLLTYTKIGNRPQIWSSYDSMNEHIIKLIR